MRKTLLSALFLLITHFVFAQTYLLSGRITDNSGKPIGFTSVYIRNSTYGTTANEDGFYQFKLSPGTYSVVYRFVGYVEKTVKITIGNQDSRNDIQLDQEIFKPRQIERVIRRNGPADSIMKQVIAKRHFYKYQVDQYSCAVYVKGVQRLLKSPKSLMSGPVAQALELDSTGKGILYQSESLSKYDFQQPNKVKEEMIASKIAGQNTAFSYNKASDLQVNFYNNLFEIEGLSSRAFISPLADNAMSYYNYRLSGVSVENGRVIDKIDVTPKREHSPCYRGYIYIIEGDWRLYSVDLLLTDDARLNLVDQMRISQQYIPITDSVWMPVSVQYTFSGKVLGFVFEGYYVGVYNNYNLNPGFKPGHFNGEIMHIDTAANTKSFDYWADTRPVPLTRLEVRDYVRKDSLFTIKHTPQYQDSVERAKNQFAPLGYFLFGYSHTNRYKGQSWYLYPFYQTLFYNTVEGWGVNLKAAWTQFYASRQSFTISPALRYSFTNNKLNGNVHFTYNYDPDRQGYFYATAGTDILDLSNAGTRSLSFNTLSTLLSENNYVKYYRSQFALLGYQRELSNGILGYLQLSYADREQLYNTSFNHIFDTKNKSYTSNDPLRPLGPEIPNSLFPKNQALTLRASVTFTFDQRYTTRPDGRYYEQSAYPKIKVNYRKGIHGLGSDVDYDFASVDIYDDHLSTGLVGYSAFKITGGSFLNRNTIYFMDYNHFLGNQGRVFDPTIGGFHFLPFYQFSTDRNFLEAHFEHNFSGWLTNRVPLINSLKLEELIGVNYLTQQGGKQNYSEFYVGIKRFFLRLDYGIAYNGSKKMTQGIRFFYGLR
ncbi:DUF5686 and carboxypeptidase regulatory-like domain-containing protein [Mucilaginibacter sp. RS28]|uniref:DUF5686 and carboxypeptidase regulatory-like domain-containing protein n=1 Tax=Mucilaginibacter straminoryzae TaxID=2932774 RepID=A0A9X1X6X4_9SPHI|nr:DUF5686 and carboxypeptidase regulatory-like domain-containing protein [Mucilaginibacter straminoryzae]MCJ8211270.1 DUF5686 and carboxypeptidase regulatory-like domain-containing protein [Mucilaginibacter straminoryzae]